MGHFQTHALQQRRASVEIAGGHLAHRATRLSLLQIARVKPFRKPALDRSEKLAALLALTLIAPEPRHAHRRAQFPGLLRSRDRKSALEISLGFSRIRRRRLKRDLTGYAIDLGLEPRFFRCFDRRHCFANGSPGFVELYRVLHRLLSDMINTTAQNLLLPLTDMQ
jgi:hypothetical protein